MMLCLNTNIRQRSSPLQKYKAAH